MKQKDNIISFPNSSPIAPQTSNTPVSDEIWRKIGKLSKVSKYPYSHDIELYKSLEKRFEDKPPRGGITFKSPFKLVNSHATCQQCLYGFEVDTYGRGCVHNCVYCYAKAELTVHGYWNKPFPMPVDLTSLWEVFYSVFETDRKTKWRKILGKRIPIRIGSMSDSFMWLDQKYKVTQEFLKMLDFYKYPYIIFTRSDLVATDRYMELLNKDLCAIQFSISSLNDEMNRKIEPGAPSSLRRLKALEKLNKAGFHTTVRLNPFFPIYPDGYFTDPKFDKKTMPEPFHYSSFDMVDKIAKTGTPAILAGVVRLSSFSLNQIEKAVGRNLRDFYKPEFRLSSRDFHYEPKEVRAYYEKIRERCLLNNVEFTTCYIGNPESQFWTDQDIWSNKKDCCNVKGHLKSFKTDSREIDWKTRMQFTSQKCNKPNDEKNLHTSLEPHLIKGKNEKEENLHRN